jgi:RHH-type rel operon transcriptional repressor/antitoxin RelB
VLTFRLAADMEARLENLAKLTGQTKTFHAREAILKYFDDLESFYLAVKRLNDFKVPVAKLGILNK